MIQSNQDMIHEQSTRNKHEPTSYTYERNRLAFSHSIIQIELIRYCICMCGERRNDWYVIGHFCHNPDWQLLVFLKSTSVHVHTNEIRHCIHPICTFVFLGIDSLVRNIVRYWPWTTLSELCVHGYPHS